MPTSADTRSACVTATDAAKSIVQVCSSIQSPKRDSEVGAVIAGALIWLSEHHRRICRWILASDELVRLASTELTPTAIMVNSCSISIGCFDSVGSNQNRACSCNQPVNHSASRSLSQPVSQPASQSDSQPASLPVSQTVQSASQLFTSGTSNAQRMSSSEQGGSTLRW